MVCPNCGSENVLVQRETTATVGVSQNKVVVEKPKKKRGCLYWCVIGWWWRPIRWIFYDWWHGLFFGKRKGGHNFNAQKNISKTMAVCQDCGYSWKV